MTTRSHTPDDDHYQTPAYIYDPLDAEFKFDFDPCPYHSTFDGLDISVCWGKSNFINPPYNRKDKPAFIRRAYNEWKENGATCVLLIPASTGTEIFHNLILPNAEVRFIKGRVKFERDGKRLDSNNGKHDSMIVIFKH